MTVLNRGKAGPREGEVSSWERRPKASTFLAVSVRLAIQRGIVGAIASPSGNARFLQMSHSVPYTISSPVSVSFNVHSSVSQTGEDTSCILLCHYFTLDSWPLGSGWVTGVLFWDAQVLSVS